MMVYSFLFGMNQQYALQANVDYMQVAANFKDNEKFAACMHAGNRRETREE